MLKPYQIENIKRNYPPGTRIELNDMEGETGMPRGLKGTVQMVDDAGQILMEWDNGRTLSLVPQVDSFRKLSNAEQEHNDEPEYGDDD